MPHDRRLEHHRPRRAARRRVARAHGVETMFTLSGAHVFPMYDGAVKADPPMRLVDVRHEQTAAFAAEATGKLTRTPGLAVLTAGPGVTNGVSAIAQAQFNGSPMVVVGGRAPPNRWGSGSLQELDQPPILAPVAKRPARCTPSASRRRHGRGVHGWPAPRTAARCSSTCRWTSSSTAPTRPGPPAAASSRRRPDPDAVDAVAELLGARRAAGADPRHRRLGRPRRGGRPAPWSRRSACPRSPTAWAAASIPGGHPLLVTKARGQALGSADLVDRGRHTARLPAGVRRLRRQGRCHPGAGRARRGLPRPGLRPRRAGRLGLRRPRRGPRRRWRTPSTAVAAQARLVAVGDRPAGDGGRRHRARPRAARPPRPTRSTRPASTASWSRGWPTTRSSSATAATSSASPASSSSRSGPAAGWTPAPTAASAPASARRSPPGSPDPRARWCCCSATARPASR